MPDETLRIVDRQLATLFVKMTWICYSEGLCPEGAWELAEQLAKEFDLGNKYDWDR